MIQIPNDCLNAIKTMIEATGEEANTELIKVYYELMSYQIMNYIGENSVPDKLIWLLREVTLRRYNITGNESTVSDATGPLSTTFRLNSLEQYYPHLDEYISQRDSNRRVRFY